MKRPAVVLALLVLVGGGIAAAALLLGGKPPRAVIMALAPASETEAVALVQLDADETQRFAVALIDAAKGAVWEVETTPNDFAPSLGRAEIAFDSERVYVVTGTSLGREVLAFARAGTPGIAWRRPLVAACVDPADRSSFTSSATTLAPRVLGDALLVFSGCETDLQIDALDRATGALRWSRASVVGRDGTTPQALSGATVVLAAGDRVVTRDRRRSDVFDLATGAPVWTDFEVRADCGIEGAGPGSALLAVRGQALVRLPLASAGGVTVVRELPGDLVARQCGRYGAHLIIVADGDDAVFAYAVDPREASGAVAWRTRLPGDVAGDVASEGAQLVGALPRFPLVLLRPGPTFATLDLETGAVVATLAPARWRGQVIGSSAVTLAADMTTHTITAVDGASGAPIGAVDVAYSDYVWGHRLVGDTLWVTGSTWTAPDALPWATIDVRTMKPVATHGGLEVVSVPATGHAPAP
ncbi:MAG: hypothetical protein CVU56_03435 [Deltaproteobacteria bacterium HGW-Deltaproteobacteria-14]|jgi:outer membrane protein assembly factor BamB|nr:MAG: hypothetical protein CVU56_03435 [Deltaproteobacteria bacterium HGW-Deltaproteobacteria-14]